MRQRKTLQQGQSPHEQGERGGQTTFKGSGTRGACAEVSEKTTEPRELMEDIMADVPLLFKSKPVPFWKRKRFHFIVGVTVGLMGALYGASTTPMAQTHLNDFQAFLALQLAEMDISSMLPATEAVDDILGNFTSFIKPAPTSDIPFMPALAFKEELQLNPHFPVVLIPGIVSSGLESWGTSEKSRKYFRKRMWGTGTMFRSVLLDKELWTKHLRLDPVTGLDPPDIKLRAAQGLDAADYFVAGYWVWAKIIENLATIGYDSNTMYLASYDWRLSFHNLEVRDKYFSKLKSTIEMYKKTTQRKSVVITHSMGGSLFPYFLKWAESPQGGQGGPHWADNHIESFVNIAGTLGGVPKALTAVLSGETRDTMAVGSFGAYLLEKFFSRRERASLMRSWGGVSSMLPKGTSVLWGNAESAPDDNKDTDQSYGNMVSLTSMDSDNLSHPGTESLTNNYTVEESLNLLQRTSPPEFNQLLLRNYSYGITTSKSQLKKNDGDDTKWANPFESQLPMAPDMKIFCFYGVGLPTERSYYYTASSEGLSSCSDPNECEESNEGNCLMSEDPSNQTSDSSTSQLPHLYIDSTIHRPSAGVETGVRFGEGDGTVPLLSLGYMCTPSGGWTQHADLYNPSHSPVKIREYLHEQPESKLDVRGGSKAGDHVDILGNWDMTLDILKIVSNQSSNVTSRLITKIDEYAQKIQLDHKP
ncbi:Lecithin:cholesterol acyltransferase-domain-containing protein [Spinellus fusiger]|nr:Lecithin:cholesterol acyltransferase-domain-containing protein [Spinellus fusiger]